MWLATRLFNFISLTASVSHLDPALLNLHDTVHDIVTMPLLEKATIEKEAADIANEADAHSRLTLLTCV